MTVQNGMRAVGLGLAATLVAPASGSVVTQTNARTGFFDSSSGTREVAFNVLQFADSPVITDIDLSVSFAKSNDNSFVAQGEDVSSGTPFLNEIEFVLTSPGGTSFTLISNDGDTEIVAADDFETFENGADGFSGTIVFDQDAAEPVDLTADLLTAGTFRPDDDTEGSLDLFNGESALGTWTFFIEDDVGSDGLSFYAFTLTVTTVPEPASLAILGFAGLGLLKRRRDG